MSTRHYVIMSLCQRDFFCYFLSEDLILRQKVAMTLLKDILCYYVTCNPACNKENMIYVQYMKHLKDHCQQQPSLLDSLK